MEGETENWKLEKRTSAAPFKRFKVQIVQIVEDRAWEVRK
jgi:hypothetical protein